MSAVVFVVAFVCCALVIRMIGTRARTTRPQPVVLEADDAWRR
ncbi:hypothetical protein ABZ894_15785 [Nocardia beijingensis]